MSSNRFIIVGGVLCGLSVVFGAFASHALKTRLDPAALQSFETGVRYQFFHAIALILFNILPDKYQGPLIQKASYLICLGILLFSGSIYFLSTRAVSGIENLSVLGPITPLGGICFISAWILFTYNAILKK